MLLQISQSKRDSTNSIYSMVGLRICKGLRGKSINLLLLEVLDEIFMIYAYSFCKAAG